MSNHNPENPHIIVISGEIWWCGARDGTTHRIISELSAAFETHTGSSVQPLLSQWSRYPMVFIRIIVGDHVKDTRVTMRSRNPQWDEPFAMSVTSTSALEFQMWKVNLLNNRMLGGATVPISELLTNLSSGLLTTTLKLVAHRRTESNTTISFRFYVLFSSSPSNTELAQGVLHQAEHGVTPAPSNIESAQEVLSQAERDVTETATAKDIIIILERVLNSLDKLAGLAAGISEICPYAKAAWGIFSFVYRVAKAQIERDTSLNDLLQKMADMLEFVHAAESVSNLDSLQLISEMVKQVQECANFICHYTRTTGFVKRTVKNIFSDADTIISNFNKSFNSLHENFDSSINISTTKIVVYMDSKLSELYDNVLLDRLSISSDGSNSRLACLDHTRVSDIDDIVKWVHDEKSLGKACLLTGLAGAGKTAVANSLAKLFCDGEALGAAYFFDKADVERNSTRNIIGTLARALAAYDISLGKLICAALKKDPGLAITHELYRQFKHLILDPASNALGQEKVVLILDALDECENIELLELLSTCWNQMPIRFCLIMTSQPLPRITELLSSLVVKKELTSGMLVLPDIRVFVKKQFAIICEQRSLQAGWPLQEDLQELVQMSQGLFIWIKIVCDLIKISQTPQPRLKDILQKKKDLAGNIDKLYLTALDAVPNWDEPRFKTAFFMLFGILMTVKVPLSVTAISDLIKYKPWPLDVQVNSILSPMSCLLQGFDRDGVIHTLHPSFHEFLTSEERATTRYYINKEFHNRKLTVTCLRLLNSQLKPNICRLKDNTVANTDIQFKSDLIHQNIPEALIYATQFIIYHLLDIVDPDLTILDLLEEFLFNHLLEWLEVLSLLNSLDTVHTLRIDQLRQWVNENSLGDQVYTMLYDITRFLWAFMPLLKTHALQVYSSALFFTPENTLLSQKYTKIYSHGLKGINLRRNWSLLLATLEGHTSGVFNVVFSPDGTRLASASWDHTVRLWDAHSGLPIGDALVGHSAAVRMVVFSPDGTKLASASEDCTVRFWNAHSGLTIGHALTGHSASVTTVIFSPDSTKLASASENHSIQLWNADSETTVRDAMIGHTEIIRTVVFSSDNTTLASASEDCTIRLWNIQTGLSNVLVGHTNAVRIVVFSPDNTTLASASEDHTVRLWNVQTGLANILSGHTETVRVVVFSPDGTRLASASWDSTIRLWNAHSGVSIGNALVGHTKTVMTVVFSPDGNTLASASEDRTVRLWNAHSGVTIGDALVGHTGPVMTVVFSPDGTRLASAAWDHTVRLWDVPSTILPEIDTLLDSTVATEIVIFSEDGTKVASVSENNTVQLWDTDSGLPIGNALVGHTKPVTTIVFSLDGTKLTTFSDDNSVSLWDTSNGQLLKTTVAFNLDLSSVSDYMFYNHTCIHEGWLEFLSNPILWIPPEYRGSIASFNGDKFCIGCSDGQVLFIIKCL